MDCYTKRTETLKRTTWNNLVVWLLVVWGNFGRYFPWLQIFCSKFYNVMYIHTLLLPPQRGFSGWLNEGGGLEVWPCSSSHFLVKIVIFCLVSVLVIPINIETKCTTWERLIYCVSRFNSLFSVLFSFLCWYDIVWYQEQRIKEDKPQYIAWNMFLFSHFR